MAYNILKHRRGTTKEWREVNLVPENGELVIEECSDGVRKCKIGDGITKFLDLPYIDDKVKEELLARLSQVESSFGTELTNLKSSQDGLIANIRVLDKKIVDNNKSLVDSINSSTEILDKKIDSLNSATTNYLNTSISELDKKFDEGLSALETQTTDNTDQLKNLEQNLKGLTGTVKNSLGPAVSELEDRLQEKTNQLESQHSAEFNALSETVTQKVAELDDKINQQAQASVTALTDKASELSTAFNNEIKEVNNALQGQLTNLETKHDESLQTTKNVLAAQLAASDELHINKIKELKEALEELAADLTKDISDLDLQHSVSHTELLSQLNTLQVQIQQLGKDDATLLNKIFGVNNTLTDITKTLADELASLKEQQVAGQIMLTKELANNVEAQQTADAGILVTLSEYITKIYVELEDLVDDDIAILTKVFSVENILGDKIRTVENTLSDRIDTELHENIEVAKEFLTAKIEAAEDSFHNELAAAKTDLSTSLVKTKSELTSHIESSEQFLTNRVTVLENDTAKNIASVEETLTNVLESSKREIASEFDEIRQTIEESATTVKSEINLELIPLKQTLSSQATTIKDNQDYLINQLTEVRQIIKDNQEKAEQVELSFESLLTQVNGRIDLTNEALADQSKRIDKILDLPPGSTLSDAVLVDIRNSVENLSGDLEELKTNLPEYIPDTAVDGLLYEDSQLYLTSKGVPVSDPVTITGGSGTVSVSKVTLTNNLSTNSFTVSKGNSVEINFTYTSFEDGIPTGDGSYTIEINNKLIEALSGVVKHNVAKPVDVTNYLKEGSNKILVRCYDQYGTPKSLQYNVSVVELRVEPSESFNSAQIFEGDIMFRYTVYGQIKKTMHILIDGNDQLVEDVGTGHKREYTKIITKQAHGVHKITAYLTAFIGTDEVYSNILEYEIVCSEPDNNEAALASVYNTTEVTQGDLISIPYVIYDPVRPKCTVNYSIYSQVGGDLLKLEDYSSSNIVDRGAQRWETRKYPVGRLVFKISYTYELYGVEKTIDKSYTINVKALEISVEAEEDGLQLYLSAAGRNNDNLNRDTWTFSPANATTEADIVTTTFNNFNWKSNGWITDSNNDTCLRLTGDARAIINFKPFAEDFKELGKTLEFEFAVRDVNNRNTTVINCYDSKGRGFKATPDTALLQSKGTRVSCRYKDNERIRVAISVEHQKTASRLVSIYLDGVLSGVQRYATTDDFSQENALNITLGSNLCGLDVYSIRVYNKALSTSQILENYIADMAEPNTKIKLFTDNNILNEDEDISYEKARALGQIPIITFTGKMPTYKGDKKKKSVRMKFEDPQHPELNFDVLLDQIDVQGTSSQFYARKNWKVKLPEAKAHISGAIPSKVFCIKVDYAEATGTHNTGTANYVETLYDREKVTLPPQKDDERVRTTIQGFPCILFEKETEDSEPVFSSKANFNYDKGSEDVFGFTKDYDSFGVECWEFKNNTSQTCNFTGNIPRDWSGDLEARYVPESANWDRIEELLEAREDASKGQGIFTSAQETELLTLLDACIPNFKQMHDWVLSTATYALNEETGIITPIEPKPLTEKVIYDGVEYNEDNEAYRLAKFKNEFNNYFNLYYCCIYYVFTFFALMTDQRAKNMFMTRWKDDDGMYRWYPYFYDNDTIFGINNEGALVFDYYHEDTDKLGSSNVYNGQNSVFWNNFRKCFPQEISNTYRELRSEEKLTYNKIIEQFVTNGSDKWSAAIYNEDADYKYISMARQETVQKDEDGNEYLDVDDSNLYQVRGPAEHHLRYFVSNRLNYCDSKWYAGKYPTDYIFLRIYTPTLASITDEMSEEERTQAIIANERITKSLNAVPANPNIRVTAFSDMYAGVKYKANGKMQSERIKQGQSFTFEPPTSEIFNDTETAIYGASELSSLGDLSGLYCGVISLGKASKLVNLTLGNSSPDYHNDNFREIRVGSNRLLKTIDLRNCSGLGLASGIGIGDDSFGNTEVTSPQTTLDLTGCPNIEEIYTEGTNLQTVSLPESGYVKILHLPASTTILNIKNQLYLGHKTAESDGFDIESYANIETLCIDNCPQLNTSEILERCKNNERYTVERVRLTGISWTLPDASFIQSLYPRFDADNNLIGGIRGIDIDNTNIDDAYLEGTCYIEYLTGAEYAEIKRHYPYLDLKFGEMTSNVTFNYSDAEGTNYIHTVPITGVNSSLGVCGAPELEPSPAWPENDAFSYELVGWSRKQQISKGLEDNEEDYKDYLQADALTGIAGDRVLYPVFKAIRKSYPITFKNPTAKDADKQLLQIVETLYGYGAVYSGEIPSKLDALSPSLYQFIGWYPDPTEKITGPMTCYAQFAVLDTEWYTIKITDISDCTDDYGNPCDGYTLNSNNYTMAITRCKNKFNPIIEVPEAFDFADGNYTVVCVGGFSDYKQLELIKFPECIEEISKNGFKNCTNLFELSLPSNLKTIGDFAFNFCKKITEVYIPATVSKIGKAPFAGCSELNEIKIDQGNTRYTVVDNCLIDLEKDLLVQGLSNGIIPRDGTVRSLGENCFNNTNIISVTVPDGITTIPDNAFSRCSKLEGIELPDTVETLEDTCFAWCSSLREIKLPKNLKVIRTWALNSTSLKKVTIPASVDGILEKAFGSIENLQEVTFETKRDFSGKVIAPTIDKAAFAGSGSDNNLVFNCPWNSSDDTTVNKNAPWGATVKNVIINYADGRVIYNNV